MQITHSTKHWSNEETMLQYIQDIIIPFIDETQPNIGADEKQLALAIFDHFKGQMRERIIQKLEDNYIYSVLIPANYKGLLLLMDVSVNEVVKSYLRSQFSKWYSDQLAEQLSKIVRNV